jgi:quercetin dioxygenase-like cupin family protein
MLTRRQAMKGLAIGSTLLSPALLTRLARAETATTTAAPLASDTGVTVRQMMVQPLPMPGNHLGVVVVVEYAPGAGSLPHSHSGPVFGYVLHGRVEIGIDQHPPVTYSEGDVWYEAPHHVHKVSRNASTTEPAKILAFLILEKGQPLLEKAKVPA